MGKCEQRLSARKGARDGHGEVLVKATTTMGLGVKGASIENTSKALARRRTLPVNARNDCQSDPDFSTTDDTVGSINFRCQLPASVENIAIRWVSDVDGLGCCRESENDKDQERQEFHCRGRKEWASISKTAVLNYNTV